MKVSMKCKKYNFLKFFLIALLVLPISEVKAIAEEKKFVLKNGFQWYPFVEWEIKKPSLAVAPFDVMAKVIFTHSKTGDSFVTCMFYDKNNTWKFRFTATIPGEWSLKTTSDDPELNGWTGKVRIKKNPDKNAHGFMKSSGNKWVWEGTEKAFVPQYVMGKNLRAYLGENGTPDMRQIEDDMEEFIKGHGFMGFHFAMEGDWFEGQNPDLSLYAVLETIISKVHQSGGGCHIWLWGANTRALNGASMNAMDKRNLRYLAARLGPLPGWSMGYGYDVENGWASTEQLNAWKSFLEGQMGWKHFLGARVGYDEKGLFAVKPTPARPPHDENFRAPIGDEYTTWLEGDYIGYTSYRPLYDRYREAINHRPEKPSFEEDRFRIRNFEGWKYKDYTEELTRRGLWHSAMAGGVANIWGNFSPQDEGIDYETLNTKGSKPYQIKDQIKTYSLFFENRFLKEFDSRKQEETLVLFTPGNDRVILYAEDKDVIDLQHLALKSKKPLVAVDTKQPYKEIIVPIKKGDKFWKAPYTSDWAIAVGNFR
jgi:hypothetical protein